REPRKIDVEICQTGFPPDQCLQRPVIAGHKLGRGNLDQIAIHQPLFNQAVHDGRPSVARRLTAIVLTTRPVMMPRLIPAMIAGPPIPIGPSGPWLPSENSISMI